MEGEPVTINKTIKIAVFIYFGALAVMFFGMWAMMSSGPEGAFRNILPILGYISLFWLVFLSVIVFISYKVAQKNKEVVREINSSKGKRVTSILVIAFGVYLILTSINLFDQLNLFLFKAGFGLVTIIWGIYNFNKSK